MKWNAGHTKYKFDENALGGHRVMNHALIANNHQDYELTDDGMNQPDDDLRTNTYGLMLGKVQANKDETAQGR